MITRLHILLIILLGLTGHAAAQSLSDIVPSRSSIVTGHEDMQSAKKLIDRLPLHHVEGIWQTTADGARVAIERWEGADCPVMPDGNTVYRLVIVDSPRKSLRPGTVMGYAVATARKGFYDAMIYTRQVKNTLTAPKRYTLQLSDDSRLSMTPVKKGWKVRVTPPRLFYLFRFSVTQQPDSRPQGLDGFIRVYPHPTGVPAEPRYL